MSSSSLCSHFQCCSCPRVIQEFSQGAFFKFHSVVIALLHQSFLFHVILSHSLSSSFTSLLLEVTSAALAGAVHLGGGTFLLGVACSICCIIKESISLRLSLMVPISTVHSGSLIETSCQYGCEGGRCTSRLTDPASRLFKVSALLTKTSEFGDVFLHSESTGATLSLKALFQASSIDTKCFHLIFIDEVPETFDHLIRSICTMVFATFIFCEGILAINKVSRQPHQGDENFLNSLWQRKGPARSHSIWLQFMPQRQDPTAISRVIYIYIINITSTPAQPVATFARHVCADARHQYLVQPLSGKLAVVATV